MQINDPLTMMALITSGEGVFCYHNKDIDEVTAYEHASCTPNDKMILHGDFSNTKTAVLSWMNTFRVSWEPHHVGPETCNICNRPLEEP